MCADWTRVRLLTARLSRSSARHQHAACTRRSNLSEDPESREAVWGFRLSFAAVLWFYYKLCATASVSWALNFLCNDRGNHYHTLTPESFALSLREQTLSRQREVGIVCSTAHVEAYRLKAVPVKWTISRKLSGLQRFRFHWADQSIMKLQWAQKPLWLFISQITNRSVATQTYFVNLSVESDLFYGILIWAGHEIVSRSLFRLVNTCRCRHAGKRDVNEQIALRRNIYYRYMFI